MRCSCAEKEKAPKTKQWEEALDTTLRNWIMLPVGLNFLSCVWPFPCPRLNHVNLKLKPRMSSGCRDTPGVCLPVLWPCHFFICWICHRCNSPLASAADDLPQNSALVSSGICYFKTHFCYVALMSRGAMGACWAKRSRLHPSLMPDRRAAIASWLVCKQTMVPGSAIVIQWQLAVQTGLWSQCSQTN